MRLMIRCLLILRHQLNLSARLVSQSPFLRGWKKFSWQTFVGGLIVLCLAAFAVPVYAAQTRPLRQDYTISIHVECLDTAMEIINQLPGYNLDSAAHFGEWSRSAEFRRRVTNDTLRYVQDVLRGMGEVISETESAMHLGARQMDLDVRIAVIDQELERLTSMMEASTSLAVLIEVNDRLSQVSRDRDALIGQRNVVAVQAQSPIINIMLSEIMPDTVREPIGFWQRVSVSFTSSAQNSMTAGGNFLVFVIRWALPVAIWGVIIAVAALIVWRLFGKKTWHWHLKNVERTKAEYAAKTRINEKKKSEQPEEAKQ